MTITPSLIDKQWSTENSNIPDICNNFSPTDIQDSCTNTDIITNYGDSSTYPAAWAAKNYKPTGTPTGKSWCLPSGGLLKQINKSKLTKINQNIASAGGKTLGTGSSNTKEEYILSSSPGCSTNQIWILQVYNSVSLVSTYRSNRNGNSVRPVMAF